MSNIQQGISNIQGQKILFSFWLFARFLYFCPLFGFYPESKAKQELRTPKIAAQS